MVSIHCRAWRAMPGSLNLKSLRALGLELLEQVLELTLQLEPELPELLVQALEQHQECPVLAEQPHPQLAYPLVFLRVSLRTTAPMLDAMI